MELVPFPGHCSTGEITSDDHNSPISHHSRLRCLHKPSESTYTCRPDTHNQGKRTLRLTAAGIIFPPLVLDYSAHRLLTIKITFNYCEAGKIGSTAALLMGKVVKL